jgi:NDP-sugar pyrophosphorylase family protein
MGKCLPTALILCGGLATRLGPLSKTKPKALMLVKGESVIDIIINNLLVSGIKRIVLCAGHLHGQLVDKFKDSKIVQISIENSPLGTGGAIRNALQHIEGNEFIVLNGDTISQIDYTKLYNQHLTKNQICTIVVNKKTERFDTSYLIIENDKVIKFIAKPKLFPPSVVVYENSGTYIFSKDKLSINTYPSVFSIEADMLPQFVKNKSLDYFLIETLPNDIGTPERLFKANKT